MNPNPDILYAADYYPGGMIMPSRLHEASTYRFGYQGQFAEKDDETGYNQFEARLYDTRINRWLTTDPAGQYWSPYLGMGNNWANGVDPDGRWYGKQKYIGDAMDAGYSRAQARDMWSRGPGASNLRYLGQGNQFSTRDFNFDKPLNNWWNKHWTGKVIPDAVYLELSVNITWFDIGIDGAEGYLLVFKGQQAGNFYKYTTVSNTDGGQGGLSTNVGYCLFTGDSRDFNVENHFAGTSLGKEVDLSRFGLADSYSTLDPNGDYLYSLDIGVGKGFIMSIQNNHTRLDARWRLPFGRKQLTDY